MVADFEAELGRLEAAYDLLTRAADRPPPVLVAADPAGEVRLQASWAAGDDRACGPAAPTSRPADNDELADRLEAIGGPAWAGAVHPGVPLPGGVHGRGAVDPGRGGARLAGRRRRRPGRDDGVGASVTLARPGRGRGRAPGGPGRGSCPTPAAPSGARTARSSTSPCAGSPAARRRGRARPAGRGHARPGHRPGRADARDASPSRCSAPSSTPSPPRPPSRLELPGAAARSPATPPTSPRPSSPASTARRSTAPVAAGAEVSKRLDRWAKPVSGAGRAHARRPARPARQGRRLVPVGARARAPRAACSPIEQALADSKAHQARWPTSSPGSSGCYAALLPRRAACAGARCT